MINFDNNMMAYLPLGTKDKLCSPSFNIPISFIYGDIDWIRIYERQYGAEVVKVNKLKFGH